MGIYPPINQYGLMQLEKNVRNFVLRKQEAELKRHKLLEEEDLPDLPEEEEE